MAINPVFLNRFLSIIKWIIILESSLGIIQLILAGKGFDGSAGDNVQGTLNTFSFLGGKFGFESVIYVINLSGLLIIYGFLATKKTFVLCLGLTAVFLSSALHLWISLIFAYGGYYILANLKKVYKIVIPLILFIFIFFSLLPNNYKNLLAQAENLILGHNPKVVMIKNSWEKMSSNPTELMFGFGLGQYSSRAALISSGLYNYNSSSKKFEKTLNLSNQSKAFEKYFKPLWKSIVKERNWYSSTLGRPVLSLFSLFFELGIILFLSVLGLVIHFLYKNKVHLGQFRSSQLDRLKRIVIVLTLYLFCLSIFENYLELSQAIFPIIVYIKWFGSFTNYD